MAEDTLYYGDDLDMLWDQVASDEFYHSPVWNKRYPRVQMLIIAELVEGKRIDYPGTNVTLKNAPRATPKSPGQGGLPGVG